MQFVQKYSAQKYVLLRRVQNSAHEENRISMLVFNNKGEGSVKDGVCLNNDPASGHHGDGCHGCSFGSLLVYLE